MRSKCDERQKLFERTIVSKIQAALFLEKKVQNFFEDNSRMSPGKKETITRNKIKKQKMYLNDNIDELHKKFKALNPSYKMSYSSFCKLRPFWTVKARVSERDTCMCVVHENMNLLVCALHDNNIIQQNTSTKLLSSITCDKWSSNCLLRKCDSCSESEVIFNNVKKNDPIYYYEWKNVKEKRISAKTK